MAKIKAKRSQAQKDKINIAVAKQLKRAGILSKQANLHSGAYISKGVLKKVREYQNIANLDYRAVKASRAQADAARARGYQVVRGNYIIGPNSPSFRSRVASGAITGIRPVRGGYMEEVTLPHDIYDMRSLVEKLSGHGGIDSLKLPTERFAFKYYGAESYRTFRNTQELLDWMLGYKSIEASINNLKPEEAQENFEHFTIFRLHPNDEQMLIPSPARRTRERKEAREQARREGRTIGRPVARAPKPASDQQLTRAAKQQRARRKAMTGDKLEAYKKAARERASRSRNNKRKG